MRTTWALVGLMGIGGIVAGQAEAVPPPLPPQAVYELHPDMRDCLYPMCGGWFVEKLNHTRMRCADGSTGAQCYVLEIDWANLGLDPLLEQDLVTEAYQDRVVIRASQFGVNVPGFGWFGALRPSQAWVAFP